ncbi:SocA family protein [Lysinibacillus sphaericus]|uniref:Panacea domain-containing protein n=1 Tax=Lysinibacillus sphaericus TaxID=1421 RepID=UPI001E46E459|nr:Panacea domain-containing protein [Lysinibacillus sphaericus]UDK97157.1 SocA family protein [Lysinibacillus sphaericus]
MVKIKHIVRYFVKNYPYKNELSKTRVTKMVYLADWYSSLDYGEQLTDIDWYFDHYGPYVPDVYNAVVEDKHLVINEDITAFGTTKAVISLKIKNPRNVFESAPIRISDNCKGILDMVIEDTEKLNWNEFIDYVYSSYPIKTSKRYKYLDLPELAEKCIENGLNY